LPLYKFAAIVAAVASLETTRGSCFGCPYGGCCGNNRGRGSLHNGKNRFKIGFLNTKYFCSLKSDFCQSVNETLGRFTGDFVTDFALRIANEPIEKIYAMENLL